MKPKLKELTPMLHTSDIEASIKFYTETLGFTCNNYHEEWKWAWLSRDSVSVMFSVPDNNVITKHSIKAATFYFDTENVDALWEELKEKCDIVYPIDNMQYGMREFGIYDNNGHLLHFGSVISEQN